MVISDTRSAGSSPNSSSITFQNATNEPINLTELNLMPVEPRYPLRRRGANQLKPYTVEQFQYKQALSANPDAIVKFRSLARGGCRRYSDGEFQGQDHTEDSGTWEESRRKRAKISSGSRSKSPNVVQDEVQYPDILQDLPSTDEEEAKQLQALSKEARKVQRERRAKEKLNREHSVNSVSRIKRCLSGGQAAMETTRSLHSSQVHVVRYELCMDIQ